MYPSFINKYVNFEGDFTVLAGTNCFMYLSQMKMNAGHKITIQGISGGQPGKLTVELTHLFSCDTMWYGINVLPNGFLNADKQNIIEDAHYAINLAANSRVTVVTTIFKQNYISINTTAGASPNCKITKNEFRGDEALQTHYVGQNPVPLPHGLAGMYIKNCTWGSSVITRNEFNNISNGILTQRCNLTINGNKFRNIRPYTDSHYQVPGNVLGSNYNGTAILTKGQGVPGTLIYTGLGSGGTDSIVFNNCRYAIAVDYANCFASNSRMVNVDYGVSSVELGISSVITKVINNRISAFLYGVKFWQAKGSISNNIIKIYGTSMVARGVSITGNSTNNIFSSINGNTIDMYVGWNAVELSSDNHSIVSNNDININHGNQANGIYLVSCSYPQYSVVDSIRNIRYNSITGGTTTNLLQRAISISTSSYVGIVCNTMNNTGEGTYFFMGNPGTNFAGNIMHNHYYGLYIPTSAFCGLQYQKGNLWNGNYSTAARNDANVSLSRFRVHTLSIPFWPPSIVSAPYWFMPFPGTPFVCDYTPPLIANMELSAIDTVIAQDSLGSAFEEPIKGSSEKYLYKKLNGNPDVVPADTNNVITKFYKKIDIKLSGRFVKTEEKIEQMLTLPQNTSADSLNRSVINLMQLIWVNDSLLETHPPDSLSLMQQNETLINYIIQKDSLIESTQGMIMQEQIYKSDIILSYNSQTNANATFEQNEKDVNDIYLSTITKGNYYFTPTQVSSLFDIAVQCPKLGGTAVYRARDLYKLICDSIIFDDDVNCYGIARLTNTPPNANSSSSSSVKMYPNPAHNMVTFDFNEIITENSILKITNSLGDFIRNISIPAKEIQHTIDVSDFIDGVYFVSIFSDKKRIYFDKLIIQR